MTPLPNIATGNRKADAKAHDAWLAENRAALNKEQLLAAEFVRLSFKTIELNKNNALAFEKAKEMHDRDVAKLILLLGDNQ